MTCEGFSGREREQQRGALGMTERGAPKDGEVWSLTNSGSPTRARRRNHVRERVRDSGCVAVLSGGCASVAFVEGGVTRLGRESHSRWRTKAGCRKEKSWPVCTILNGFGGQFSD
jgi:hypothetical protein